MLLEHTPHGGGIRLPEAPPPRGCGVTGEGAPGAAIVRQESEHPRESKAIRQRLEQQRRLGIVRDALPCVQLRGDRIVASNEQRLRVHPEARVSQGAAPPWGQRHVPKAAGDVIGETLAHRAGRQSPRKDVRHLMPQDVDRVQTEVVQIRDPHRDPRRPAVGLGIAGGTQEVRREIAADLRRPGVGKPLLVIFIGPLGVAGGRLRRRSG